MRERKEKESEEEACVMLCADRSTNSFEMIHFSFVPLLFTSLLKSRMNSELIKVKIQVKKDERGSVH